MNSSLKRSLCMHFNLSKTRSFDSESLAIQTSITSPFRSTRIKRVCLQFWSARRLALAHSRCSTVNIDPIAHLKKSNRPLSLSLTIAACPRTAPHRLCAGPRVSRRARGNSLKLTPSIVFTSASLLRTRSRSLTFVRLTP
jgi:hypothetical protein